MSINFTDGMHNWDPSVRFSKGWSNGGGYVSRNTSFVRRPGSASLLITNSPTTAGNAILTFENSVVSQVIGFAVYCPSAYIGWSIYNSEGIQLTIVPATDGAIKVYRGTSSGTVIALSSPGAFIFSTWLYIEFKITIDDAAGEIEIHINGDSENPVIAATGLNTKNQATADMSAMHFSQTMYITDVFKDDTDFHGNVTIDTRYPDGVGTHTDMVASYGSNYACVDENGGANSTDYVETDTIGAIDTYTFADINVDGHVIHAVNHFTAAFQTDAGTVGYTPKTVIASTDYDGVEDNTTTDVVLRWYVQETNPATAAAWTESEINSTEFGVELTELV